MKFIVRTRDVNSIRVDTMMALNEMNADYEIKVHPKGLTFAEFHNFIFADLKKNELYCFLDDDIVPDAQIYIMEKYLLNHPELTAVCGVARANNNKVMMIQSLCIKKSFNFATCIIRGSFLHDIIIPQYLECSEDDWVRKEMNADGKKYEVMNEFSFDHLSDDWENKFLKGIEWHTANATLHYMNNGRVIDEICPFNGSWKGVEEYAQRLHALISRIDRKLAAKTVIAIRQGFSDYEHKLKNR